MNLYIYETETSAVVVDYGVMFADSQLSGIDMILPDASYLESIRDKVKAVLFTHGHEDHIGGAVNLLNSFSADIYTGEFTAELVRYKIRNSRNQPQVNVIKAGGELQLGDISAGFFPVPHSIPDTFGIVIKGGNTTAVHLSDFRTDNNGRYALKHLVSDSVDALFLDSTNASSHKTQISEEEIYTELEDIFRECEGRVFFTTFASNVARISSAIKAARLYCRKIVIEGAAMERTIAIASRLGLLHLTEDDIASTNGARRLAPSKLLYIVSGCQGEVTSALYPIAIGERKAVQMLEGDTLIFSSRIIPGNERNINNMINAASRRCVNVITSYDRKVHTSGHATPEELEKAVIEIKPKYFIPVHGEFRHIYAHLKIAESAGMAKENCLRFETGDQLVFNNGVFVRKETVSHGRYYFDSRGAYLFDESAMSVRKNLARDGLVIIEKHPGRFDLRTYGFTLTNQQKKDILTAVELSEKGDEELTGTVKRYFKKQYMRRPVIDIIDFGDK